jgi:L-lactate utilization protein LutC
LQAAELSTGPSRTGDIERIIVLAAHGPRVLTVILVSPI